MTEPCRSPKDTRGNEASSLSNFNSDRSPIQDGSSVVHDGSLGQPLPAGKILRPSHDDRAAFLSSSPLLGAKDFSLCTHPVTPDFKKEAAFHKKKRRPLHWAS